MKEGGATSAHIEEFDNYFNHYILKNPKSGCECFSKIYLSMQGFFLFFLFLFLFSFFRAPSHNKFLHRLEQMDQNFISITLGYGL